jgi:class 3 adenylate cyclase/tetratricopeptide (TPR) repeat protein
MLRCPSCARDNPDDQKFCGECGARLSSAAPENPENRGTSYTPPHAREILTSRFALEGERKLVTVMFCDIVNSTPLAARLGAEAMHGLLNRLFELALGEVHRYEGTINHFLGDGFMALFGAPIAHEDHARRALLAATAIQQQMGQASGPLGEVRLRMGLNTGTVVVGKIGDNLRMDYTAIGDTANLAARLQGFAEPGSIRVSEATRRAAEAHVTFKDLGRHPLKGIVEPVAIFEPIGARSRDEAASRHGAIGSALVGREQQLAALTRSLSGLAGGKGGIVIIQGEPGAGKSRLLAEARKSKAAQGATWLEGRSVSFGRSLSYLPFIEIMKGAFGIMETDSEAAALAKLEAGVGRVFEARAAEFVPYLATVMALELTGDLKQRVAFLDAQAMKRQVFLTTRQLLERSAQLRPVLIVLEDWHWVDQSSIALLEHLLPLAQDHPVAFWLTTRAEPAEPAQRVRAAAAALPGPPREEVAVAPLAAEDSRLLLDNLIGAGSLPEPVRAQIERRTEGNPFFIEEVVRALIAEGTLVRNEREGGFRLSRQVADLAIPNTVQGVIVARIDRLEESVKGVLKLAAVIGRSFFLRILKAIAQAADDVEGGLGRLEAAELIRLRQQVPELEYIFKHALVQEAAYGSILVERRRAIHGAVGQAIESLFPERLEEFASVLAHHYALAEDWEKAQAWLFKAGDQAGRMAADAEALEHYHQAETAFMKVAGRTLTPLQRATLDRKLGQAYYGVGDYEQCVAMCTRALGHLGVIYPRTKSGVRRKTAMMLASHFLRRPKIDTREISLAAAQEISAVCRFLAWLDYFVDEERFMLDSLIELQAAERSGDVLGRVRGLATLGVALSTFRAFKLAWRRVNEATAIARQSGDPASLAMAAGGRGWLQLGTGPLAEAGRTIEHSAAVFRSIGDIRGWGGSAGSLSWIQFWRADFAAASNAATEMVQIGSDAGDPYLLCWGQHGVGMIKSATGPLDEAAAGLVQARELATQNAIFRSQAGCGGMLGKCRLRQGRLQEAEAALGQSLQAIESKNLRGRFSSSTFQGLTELWLIKAERGHGTPRRHALRQASKYSRRAYACTRDAIGWLPETQRLLGRLAWVSGNFKTARQQWQMSLATAEKSGNTLERARTLLELGQRTANASLIEEAGRVFENIGARVDLAFSLQAMARLAARSSRDPTVTLCRYDEAIRLLESVKAEYAFGLACQERAQLLAHAGRKDDARADLTRALSSFEAVGADAEKHDAEKAAEALGLTFFQVGNLKPRSAA